MFVSGETADPPLETTTLIETIVQQQVIEMLSRATLLAARRGVRAISTDDLIFLIRHDKAKVARLRTFLSWKDVRKSAKDSDEKAGANGPAGGGGGGAGGGAGDGLDDFELQDGATAGNVGGNRKAASKKAKVGLPWDVATFFSEQVPERDDEEDEEEEEMNAATLARLKSADERTKDMTPDEYLHWSECRQASFTFRKGKRFREWAGFGIVTEAKPNDDIVDILGFLTFEIVQTLTEEAINVKCEEDNYKKGRRGQGLGADNVEGEDAGGLDDFIDDEHDDGHDDEGEGDGILNLAGSGGAGRKRKRREPGLFDPHEQTRTPVAPRHVQEALRRLQRPATKMSYMSHLPGSSRRRTVSKLI